MPNKPTSYPKLLEELKTILFSGQAQALEQLQKIRAETYWKMGQCLWNTPELKTSSTLPAQWVQNLTRDLALDRSLLYRILKFYKTYPKGLPKTKGADQLSWTSHLLLLPLQDEKERRFYLKQAVEQTWSKQQLQDALKQNLYQAAGAIHESSLPEKGKKKVKLQRPKTGLYLYQAVVERVIDGDTLLVSVDLGFDVWKKQRLRLRAIDCAELKNSEGQAAKAFVQEILQPIEFVILKTYKMDLHGRFVCDVFFSPGQKDKQKVFAKGTFLNQLLVEQGHATVVG